MSIPPSQKSVGSLGLRTLLVFGIAAWLLVSAFGKFFSIDTFHDALQAHEIVPRELIPVTTWAFPALEAVVGIYTVWRLLTGRSLRSAALPLIVIFGLLTGYTTLLAIHPPAEPTGCGCGIASGPVEHWWPLAARNAVVVVILALCWSWRGVVLLAWESSPDQAAIPRTLPATPSSVI